MGNEIEKLQKIIDESRNIVIFRRRRCFQQKAGSRIFEVQDGL